MDSNSNLPQSKIIRDMISTIEHRGPDNSGIYDNGSIALGMTRLSIIDLKGGKQPIFNEKRDVIVVFNGEIYNFVKLRKQLKNNGHLFRTNSDTEVIAHLYEEKKEKLFHDLNGMFAIAIYDKKENKLIIARDRFGEKPLYYSIKDKLIVFGSELKAILKHPEIKREIDINSLHQYLALEYVPTPNSIFRNIFKLPAGHYLVFQNNHSQIIRYWNIRFKPQYLISEREAVEKIDELLSKSVKERLVSDVSLGLFLSGGLDSSTIAYYSSLHSSKVMESFSVGFGEKSYDESEYSKLVANKLNLKHHHCVFRFKDFMDILPKISSLLDEPFADASIYPTYFLSQFTRRNVKVALGGDGSDELLMGYPTYYAHKIAEIYKMIPEFITKNIILPVVNVLPVSHSNMSFDFKIKKFFEAVYDNPAKRNLKWLGAFNNNSDRKLLVKLEGSEGDPVEKFESVYRSDLGLWSGLIEQYIKSYLADDILFKVDRASMFNSLEVRSPFLDYDLSDFICRLPSNLKLKGSVGKYILKKAMIGKLPYEIIFRKKHGFGIPVSLWLKKDMRKLMLSMLNKERVNKQGFFNYQYIEKLIKEHLSGSKNNRKQIWTLFNFQLWADKWLN